MQVETEIN